MELQSDDQSVIAEEINPQTLTNQQKCTNLQSIDKQIRIFTARKEYVTEMRLTLKRASLARLPRPPRSWKLMPPAWMKRLKPLKVVCLNYYLAQCLNARTILNIKMLRKERLSLLSGQPN
ncbi:hypothetical protein TNIN_185251 [Trichonephila inaurata madagascariensis]|uniref:Uncharacterized protein n=1 Tax=Trichonephila inaurata madagascariensis TaxID=2747483 RepID=A0A8X6MGV2_9ARAC|nr:hypothetical protein TNIN_185251 [Trichonephila inaurata madagascariensis]